MSVVKSKRGESNMEFLYTARLLQIYSIRKCVGFPKRYTFYVSQPIANAAVRAYENVKRGNSIYPANRHEAQMRRDYFIQAFAELQSMVSQIEAAAELGITLNEKKTQIVKLSHGFSWLKVRFYLTETGKIVRKIQRRSVTRMRRKLKVFGKLVSDGIMTMDDVRASWQSWRSYAEHFNAWRTVQHIAQLLTI